MRETRMPSVRYYIPSQNMSVSLSATPHMTTVIELDSWEGKPELGDDESTARTRRTVLLDPASALTVQYLLAEGSAWMLAALGRYLTLPHVVIQKDESVKLAFGYTTGVPQIIIDCYNLG